MEVIYRDEAIAITQDKDVFYLESFNKGTTLESFNELLKQFPYIKITSFITVKNVLSNAPYGPEMFACVKERISIEISKDGLEAYMTLNIPEQELAQKKRNELVMELMDALQSAGIKYGILFDALKGELHPNMPILAARGTVPVNGKDSVIKMYTIPEPKPRIIDNGNVNYYDLNLINQVQAGEWLGERLDPVPGVPGMSVRGTEIKPLEGEYYPLLYDRNSVELVREEGRDVLYSLKSGAVHYAGDYISVYDVMEIKGDVDFNSGNIDFNGFVTIRGGVEENFSVRAKNDIDISGEYGLGGVNTIESLEGSIYIRGGAAGKNRAKLICKKNLYVKYLSDTEVICGGTVYIGFYARNSIIKARQVIVESPRGQIVGGLIDADIRVECAEIGNRMESKTNIVIRGFNRAALMNRMDEISALILEKKEQLVRLKIMLKDVNDRPLKDNSLILKTRQALRLVQDDILTLEGERLGIINYLKTPGDGAIIVKKRIFPRVRLVIQNISMEITEETLAPTYIVRNGMIQAI